MSPQALPIRHFKHIASVFSWACGITVLGVTVVDAQLLPWLEILGGDNFDGSMS